jgi:imidazolonepropionase-like amidohydrolase
VITVIANGSILDSRALGYSVEGDVVIEDGVIRQVGGRHSGAADVIVDARGKYVMPGLIDAHVHFRLATMNFVRLTAWTEVEFGIAMARLARETVGRGFTTVRDLGGDTQGLRRAIDSGMVVGPRILAAGQMLTQTGGHGDTRGGDLHAPQCACEMSGNAFGLVCDGVDAVIKGARHLLRNGSDFLKVHVSGGVASPADPIDGVQYTHEEIRAAVTEAAHRHTYVAAHAYNPDSIIMAVESGVRTIEHGNLIDATAATAVAAHGAFMVPTLVTYSAMNEMGAALGLPKRNIEKNVAILEAGLRSLEIAISAGVTLGFGTDLIGETQSFQNRELAIRSEVQPARDILDSLWNVNARILRREGSIGVLAEGAHGDVVVSHIDPLSDIKGFARQDSIAHVVLGGNVIAAS